jgi:hypothetical protein
MSTTSTIDNMSIDELAQYLKTGSIADHYFIYAARRMGNIYFTHKNKQIVELTIELQTIYEKFPETRPY